MNNSQAHKATHRQIQVLSANVIISVTLALFIFGLSGLLILQARQLSLLVRSTLEIQVFLERNLTSSAKEQIRLLLAEQNFVKAGDQSIEYISKQQAKKAFIKDTGEDFSQFLGDNPLRDSYLVKVKAEFYESDQLTRIQQDLEAHPQIYEVSYVKNMVDRINQNLGAISLFLLLFGFFMLLTVVVLIDNTIRIALFSQRFLIRSMQLVGATDHFIQKPFLQRALVQGATSGVLAFVLLFGFLKYMQSQIIELNLLFSWIDLIILSLGLILLGACIGGLSSYRSVRKHLHSSLDELYR